MKKCSFYTTVCLILCSTIGAGYVGGKELVTFFGEKSWLAIALFGLLLALSLITLVSFCKRGNVTNFLQFSKLVYSKASTTFTACVSLSLFFVVIALLSVTSDCIETVVGLKTNLPIYPTITAIVAFCLLSVGKDGIEKFTKWTFPLSVLFIVTVSLLNGKIMSYDKIDAAPIIYAYFNFVPLLAVFCTQKEARPIWIVLGVALLVALTVGYTFAIQKGKDFALPLYAVTEGNVFLTYWGIAVTYLSGLTSLVLCALPIDEFLQEFVDDKHIRAGCIFTLGVAFSNFGFEKIANLTYPLIALLGLVTFVLILTKKGKVALATDKKNS